MLTKIKESNFGKYCYNMNTNLEKVIPQIGEKLLTAP